VFECKYELDSLCGFLKITRSYYSNTKDSSFINSNWLDAVDQIMQVIEDQSKPSFDKDFNFFSAYNWTGLPGALSGPVVNGGNNAPKAYTGLVATHHRPSDDLSLLRELIS
jgi:meiotically up-regulated gene 157 (Mug157) protein